jgi:hypothetical protein
MDRTCFHAPRLRGFGVRSNLMRAACRSKWRSTGS